MAATTTIGADRRLGSAPKAVRCAIYTRKSTTDGLEQDFNTLDAQREAGEAYVESQASRGFVLLPTRYDDAGFSGASLERPAFRQLTQDIDAGNVDLVVVQRFDRLSRSLFDFLQLLRIWDAKGIGLVSVTQQFDTSTPIGRLTLTHLLSFAQFEREMISERTRDKMGAARRKGQWTGGNPILGYDVAASGGALVVNESEAERVRAVFSLYLEVGSISKAVTELRRRGWTTKQWQSRKGHLRGGNQFNKSSLAYLLKHPIYIGKVRYQGAIYDGEHEAIVDEDVWRRVQARLAIGAPGASPSRQKHNALLAGLLHCGSCGRAMTHTYTKHRNRQYRYYRCIRASKEGRAACASKALPAGEIEAFVVDHVKGIGQDDALLEETIRQVREEHPDVDEGDVATALARFEPIWEALTPAERIEVLQLLVERITFDGKSEEVAITFRWPEMMHLDERGGGVNGRHG